jgi:hypothetical protein
MTPELEPVGERDAVVFEPRAVATLDPIMRLATSGVPIETIKELVGLYREERAHQAKQAFASAFSAFKALCPSIKRNRTADFATKAGALVKYTFADLAQIATSVQAMLHQHGFAYSWTRATENGRMTVTCRLIHSGGHSETSEFSVPIEGTQLMSEPQKYKAALTFAERVSLSMVLGLSDTDEDTDASDPEALNPISPEQVLELEGLISETKANRQKFLAYMEVTRLEDLTAGRFADAVKALQNKRRTR